MKYQRRTRAVSVWLDYTRSHVRHEKIIEDKRRATLSALCWGGKTNALVACIPYRVGLTVDDGDSLVFDGIQTL